MTGRILARCWYGPQADAGDRLRLEACVEFGREEESPVGIERGPVGV